MGSPTQEYAMIRLIPVMESLQLGLAEVSSLPLSCCCQCKIGRSQPQNTLRNASSSQRSSFSLQDSSSPVSGPAIIAGLHAPTTISFLILSLQPDVEAYNLGTSKHHSPCPSLFPLTTLLPSL